MRRKLWNDRWDSEEEKYVDEEEAEEPGLDRPGARGGEEVVVSGL